ncbi:MAG TPA: hypothetical protein VEL07_15400 [Planctomycetota bacterium]|nr:hypothetical protein [Planctomycetota bacterium]
MATATDEAALGAAAEARARREREQTREQTGPAPAGAGSEFSGLFAQVREVASFYIQTRLDRVRVTVTKLIITAMLVAVAGVIGLAVIAAAAFFLLAGAVQALAAVIDAPGVALLIVGGGLLALAGIGVWFITWRMRRGLRQRLVAKYSDHHARQRADLGQDVAQMAGRPQASLTPEAQANASDPATRARP